MLTVTTPAPNRDILTFAELKAALGITGPAQDAAIDTLKVRIEMAITSACRVMPDGIAIPTLRSETLTEVIRMGWSNGVILQLARRPVTAVNSVTEGTASLGSSDYEIDRPRGALLRLSSSGPSFWAGGSAITVQYVAGFAVVPDDLKLAASKLAVTIWNEGLREPGVRRENIPGVREVEFWVPPTSDPLIDNDIDDLLAPYKNWFGA